MRRGKSRFGDDEPGYHGQPSYDAYSADAHSADAYSADAYSVDAYSVDAYSVDDDRPAGDDRPAYVRHRRQHVVFDRSAEEIPGGGDRWSTWDLSTAGERGPKPYPDWLVTELAAVDVERGLLKTGKEADVHLLWRGVPDSDRACLLAAKRYRSAEHRMFHRDAGYQEGRRVRRSREIRAMRNRTGFGRELLAAQWAYAEFEALRRLWELGASVPYPVQLLGTELLLEFLGDADGTAAPRLAEIPTRGPELAPLWSQLIDMLVLLAGAGLAHADLSAYNLLVHHGRLVMIDLPQVVDVIANPQGRTFLARDAANVATWFRARGLPAADPDGLRALLLAEAGLG